MNKKDKNKKDYKEETYTTNYNYMNETEAMEYDENIGEYPYTMGMEYPMMEENMVSPYGSMGPMMMELGPYRGMCPYMNMCPYMMGAGYPGNPMMEESMIEPGIETNPQGTMPYEMNTEYAVNPQMAAPYGPNVYPQMTAPHCSNVYPQMAQPYGANMEYPMAMDEGMHDNRYLKYMSNMYKYMANMYEAEAYKLDAMEYMNHMREEY